MKQYIVVCEGRSEYVYLQRLQSFLDSQTTEFDVPLKFYPRMPRNASGSESGGGDYKNISVCYRQQRKDNRHTSIEMWVDYDLYLRNNRGNRDQYMNRPSGIPSFRFSFHNFEDFLMMHMDDETVQNLHSILEPTGHYIEPLYSTSYMPLLNSIVPNYQKGDISPDFITKESLSFLKINVQSPKIPPSTDPSFGNFATFLIGEIETAFPTFL